MNNNSRNILLGKLIILASISNLKLNPQIGKIVAFDDLGDLFVRLQNGNIIKVIPDIDTFILLE